jgi:hypothetical protein
VSAWGFYFYTAIGKPLYEVALNLQELKQRIEKVPALSLEFHQQRGDFARWIQDVFNEEQLAKAISNITTEGENLRHELLTLLNKKEALCPRCGQKTKPVKTWKMAGRPSKAGFRFQLTIAYYKCSNCNKTYRKVIGKEKVPAK